MHVNERVLESCFLIISYFEDVPFSLAMHWKFKRDSISERMYVLEKNICFLPKTLDSKQDVDKFV
jgi:hypothetical protein